MSMRLEDVVIGQRLHGAADEAVEVVATTWLGADYLQITYRDVANDVQDMLLDRTQEANLRGAASGDGVTLGGDPELWKEATEALRFRHAALLDPMLAVSHS